MVNFAITPFTDIVKPGELIEEVRLLYTAETLQRPILQMFDIGGHIARHLKGPRAKDQTNSECFSLSYFHGVATGIFNCLTESFLFHQNSESYLYAKRVLNWGEIHRNHKAIILHLLLRHHFPNGVLLCCSCVPCVLLGR